MAGNNLQVNASGNLVVSSGGNLVVAGTGDPCCCDNNCHGSCLVTFTITSFIDSTYTTTWRVITQTLLVAGEGGGAYGILDVPGYGFSSAFPVSTLVSVSPVYDGSGNAAMQFRFDLCETTPYAVTTQTGGTPGGYIFGAFPDVPPATYIYMAGSSSPTTVYYGVTDISVANLAGPCTLCSSTMTGCPATITLTLSGGTCYSRTFPSGTYTLTLGTVSGVHCYYYYDSGSQLELYILCGFPGEPTCNFALTDKAWLVGMNLDPFGGPGALSASPNWIGYLPVSNGACPPFMTAYQGTYCGGTITVSA